MQDWHVVFRETTNGVLSVQAPGADEEKPFAGCSAATMSATNTRESHIGFNMWAVKQSLKSIHLILNVKEIFIVLNVACAVWSTGNKSHLSRWALVTAIFTR